ncbi:hypothetical protein [Chromatocurvus halotolerans]|nr:hypothetical protein [Chromatocurvus halotolerans]
MADLVVGDTVAEADKHGGSSAYQVVVDEEGSANENYCQRIERVGGNRG